MERDFRCGAGIIPPFIYLSLLSHSDPLFALPGVWRVVWSNPASAAVAAAVGLDPLITLMRAGLGVLCSPTTRVVQHGGCVCG